MRFQLAAILILTFSSACKNKDAGSKESAIVNDAGTKIFGFIAVNNDPSQIGDKAWSDANAAKSARAAGTSSDLNGVDYAVTLVTSSFFALVECEMGEGKSADAKFNRLLDVSSKGGFIGGKSPLENVEVNQARQIEIVSYGKQGAKLQRQVVEGSDCILAAPRLVSGTVLQAIMRRFDSILKFEAGEGESEEQRRIEYSAAQAFYLSLRSQYPKDGNEPNGIPLLARYLDIINSVSPSDINAELASATWAEYDEYFVPCSKNSEDLPKEIATWKSEFFSCVDDKSNANYQNFLPSGNKYDEILANVSDVVRDNHRGSYEELYTKNKGDKTLALFNVLTATIAVDQMTSANGFTDLEAKIAKGILKGEGGLDVSSEFRSTAFGSPSIPMEPYESAFDVEGATEAGQSSGAGLNLVGRRNGRVGPVRRLGRALFGQRSPSSYGTYRQRQMCTPSSRVMVGERQTKPAVAVVKPAPASQNQTEEMKKQEAIVAKAKDAQLERLRAQAAKRALKDAPEMIKQSPAAAFNLSKPFQSQFSAVAKVFSGAGQVVAEQNAGDIGEKASRTAILAESRKAKLNEELQRSYTIRGSAAIPRQQKALKAKNENEALYNEAVAMQNRVSQMSRPTMDLENFKADVARLQSMKDDVEKGEAVVAKVNKKK